MATKLHDLLIRTRFDDGLLDLFVGAGFILIGLAWLADLIPLAAIIPAVLMPFWKPARQRFTIPRMGAVSFSAPQNQEQRTALIKWVIFGVVVLFLELGIFVVAIRRQGEPIQGIADLAVGLPTALLGLALLAGAMLAKAKRYVAYTLAAFASCAGAIFWRLDEPGIGILAIGIVVLVSGLVILGRFLRRHPLSGSEGASYGE